MELDGIVEFRQVAQASLSQAFELMHLPFLS